MKAAVPSRSFARNLLRLAAGLTAGFLVYTAVSFVVTECIRDLRNSASHPTSARAVR